jgi:integrating conjugative element protein (TIGR03755 family)
MATLQMLQTERPSFFIFGGLVMSMRKKTKAFFLFFLFWVLWSASPSYAQTVRPNGDDAWYFSMGGSDPYVSYRQSNRTNINLSAGAEWNLLRACRFDPRTSITETFGDIQQSIYGLANDVVAMAPGLLTMWGLQQVQENYPGVYDFMTKGLADAKASYQVALKSCQDMKNDVRSGRDPLEGWIRGSKKVSWDTASQTGQNPVEHVGNMDRAAADSGVVWIKGVKKGGKNQEPIRAVGDTIEAGYEHLTTDLSADASEDSVTGDKNITRVFPTKASASKWVAAVVGEREVRTCEDCQKLTTKVGQGLRLKHKEERDIASDNLSAALAAPVITDAMLKSLSVPGMGLVATESTLRSIKNAPSNEQRILMNRYVSEIALARVMEKGLIAKDLFNMGEQEPNISVNPEAQEEIEFSKKRLNQELENIVFENAVRKTVLNNATTVIAERGKARDASAKGNMLKTKINSDKGMTAGGVNAN